MTKISNDLVNIEKRFAVEKKSQAQDKNLGFEEKLAQNLGYSDKDGTNLAQKKAAAEYEIVYESFMYNQQFSTVPVDSLMGGGVGEEMFRSQLVDAMIKKTRMNNPGKIAQAIYEKIKDDPAYDYDTRRIPKSNE